MGVADYAYRLLLHSHKSEPDNIIKVDEQSSTFAYVGSAIAGSLTSQAKWRIARIYRQGTLYSVEFAGAGLADQIWDNRTTLFDAGALSNNYSLDFDGINDYVTFGNNYNYDHSTAFSVSAWVKPQNFSVTRTFMGKVDQAGTVYGWRLGFDTSGKFTTQVRTAGSTNAAQSWSTTLTADTWYHFVWVWTGSSNQSGQLLYINGVAEAFTPPSSTLVTSWVHAYPFEIGRAPANYFVGNIDEPMIWNKALSAGEVTELYNSGAAIDPTTTSMTGNLVSWWKMGDNDTYPTILDQKSFANGTMTNMTSDDLEADVP